MPWSVLLEFCIRNLERLTVSLLDILFYPDAQLRRTAAAVGNVDGKLVTLIDHMLETMYDAPGIGLAATQVNVHQRVVVIDVSEENDAPLTLINPEILLTEGTAEMQEGCLSIPGVYETVKRPAEYKLLAIHLLPFRKDYLLDLSPLF